MNWLAIACLLGAAQVGGGAGLHQAPKVAAPVLGVAAGTTASGALIIAWIEHAAADQVHAARWDADHHQWKALGNVINEKPHFNASQLSLVSDPRSGIWLAHSEGSGEAHIDSYLISRWNGHIWSEQGSSAVRRNLSDAGRSRALGIEPGGAPLLAWTDIGTGPRRWPSVVILKTWQPQAQRWQDSPPMNLKLHSPAYMPSVAAFKQMVSVAYVEGAVTQSNVYVRQYPAHRQGRWRNVGAALNFKPLNYVYGPQLKLNAAGLPTVAWLEDLQGRDVAFVSTWTGQHWQRLGAAVSAPEVSASALSLALDAAGRPLLAWVQGPDGSRAPHLAHWTGRRWQALALARTPHADSDSTSLALSAAGGLLAWREYVGGHWILRVQALP